MAEGVPSDELLRYFSDARSWEQDRARAALRSRRIAWTIAVSASLVAMVALGAVAALAPLKTTSAYIVRVNETTGAVDVLTELTDRKAISSDEAVTKANLAQYVQAREGWLPAAAKERFRLVAIMSDPAEQQRWAKRYDPNNPLSPQAWGANASAHATILSISFINRQIATVRYKLELTKDGREQVTFWVATVTFGYSSAPIQEADRFLNPLGFQVENYRSDPEVLP